MVITTSSKPAGSPAITPPPKPTEQERLTGIIKTKVDRLNTVTDVLTGKSIPGGKVGTEIRKLRAIDADATSKKGNARRQAKFKEFDIWLKRQQFINNTRDGAGDNVPYVELKRHITIQDAGKQGFKVI